MKKYLFILPIIAFSTSGCGFNSSSNSSDQLESDELSLPTINSDNVGQVDNNNAIITDNFELIFNNNNGKYSISIAKKQDNIVTYFNETPAQINVRGQGSGVGVQSFTEKTYMAAYDKLERKKYGFLLSSAIKTSAGSEFLVEDSYYLTAGNVLSISRNVKVVSANASDAGFSSVYSLVNYEENDDYSAFDYFIPAIIYKDTKNVVNGAIASNMDLDKISVKETRTGLPLAFLKRHSSDNSISLYHLEPEISVGNNIGGGVSGEINDELQYGAIGYSILPSVGINYTYPCTEGPNTYDAGQGVSRRYHSVLKDNSHTYKLGIIPTLSDNYNDSMVETYMKAYESESRKIVDISMDDVYSENIKLFNDFYKEYTYNNKVVTAGFPWSLDLPNATNKQGYTFQMGFVGQQIPAAYHLLRTGLENNDSELMKKGETIIDFWTSNTINSTYFPTVWWDPQNNLNGGNRRNYPSFLRCMVDGMEGILDAYRTAVAYGLNKTEWYNAVYKNATNLIAKQNDDGSFCRAYRIDGSVETDTSDPKFAGTSKLNTPIAVRYLCKMYELTHEERFKNAAIKAANYCYDNLYLQLGKYVGGTPDNPNTVDKEAAVYGMYCFNSIYALTKDEKYLKAAMHAAVCAMSWTYTYDFAVPNSSIQNVSMNPFSNGGVMGFSIIATGHSAADNYSAYTFFDTYRLYVLTGEKFFYDAALLLQNNTKSSGDYWGKIGYAYKAMMPEATNVSDFAFKSVGTWLPWSGVANIEPIRNFKDAFGVNDINKLNTSKEMQQSMLDDYGCGGKTLNK